MTKLGQASIIACLVLGFVLLGSLESCQGFGRIITKHSCSQYPNKPLCP